jgi:pilus assembly protein Flp/PilA
MKKCIDFMIRLGRDEEGTALLEYTMLFGLIAVAVIATALAIGGWIGGRWADLCTAISGSGVGSITCPATGG